MFLFEPLRASCSSESSQTDERRVCSKHDRSIPRDSVALAICSVSTTIARQKAQPERPMSVVQRVRSSDVGISKVPRINGTTVMVNDNWNPSLLPLLKHGFLDALCIRNAGTRGLADVE
jgi:hypothetical protein